VGNVKPSIFYYLIANVKLLEAQMVLEDEKINDEKLRLLTLKESYYKIGSRQYMSERKSQRD